MRLLLKDLRCRWRRKSAESWIPFRRLSPKSVLVIAPHPDDETFGCGGFIALKRRMGVNVNVVFLTDGGASLKCHAPISSSEVANIRKREAILACGYLGLGIDALKNYGLPDENVPSRGTVGFEDAVQKLLADIRQLAPSEILCPHPLDGHGDHKAAAEMALEALQTLEKRPRIIFYPVWAWYTAPWGLAKTLDFGCAWKVDGRAVHQQKLRAIRNYLDHLEPNCGIPYCGRLQSSIIYCAMQRREIFFDYVNQGQ